MKNKISDLNNYLFEQIERLNDDNLSGDELDEQLKKSKTIIEISKVVIDSGSLALQAKKHMDAYGAGDKLNIPLLGIANEKVNEAK